MFYKAIDPSNKLSTDREQQAFAALHGKGSQEQEITADRGRAATLPSRDSITEYTGKHNRGFVTVTRVRQQPCDCQPYP